MTKQIPKNLESILASNKRAKELWTEVAYIRESTSYYHKKLEKMFKVWELSDLLLLNKKIIEEFRFNEILDEYDWLIFSDENKPWYYNLFSRDILLPIWDKPIIDERISLLLEKISWWDEKKVYLEKLILYKYYHPTDYTIPCIVLHWNWWIWKGQFCRMLWEIFWWEKYTLLNLWQKDLSWSFTTYKWNKLIVEFAELYSHDTHQDKQIMNTLKNTIWQKNIVVNNKFQAQYEMSNPALFFITSNYDKPIHLDANTWNRRFTVIKSLEKPLTENEAISINNMLFDKEALSNFLCYLENRYWEEVKAMKQFRALENEDKQNLTMASLSDSQRFWKFIADNYKDEKIFWKDLLEWKKDDFWIPTDSHYIKKFLDENPDIDRNQLVRWVSKECPFVKKMMTSNWKNGYWIKIDREFII